MGAADAQRSVPHEPASGANGAPPELPGKDASAALLQQLQQVCATTQAQAEAAKQRLSEAEADASQAEAAGQRLAQAQLEASQASAACQAAYQALNIVTQPQQTTPAPDSFDYPNTAYIEELEQAVDSESVSFSQTLLALRIGSGSWLPNAHTKRARELGPKLLELFQAKYGRILESRYAEAAVAGVVLLERVDESTAPGSTVPEPTTVSRRPRIVRWMAGKLRRISTGSSKPPTYDPPHTPRAGDMDAEVMWHWLNFNSQDATNLLSMVLTLRDRITTFLRDDQPLEKDARDIALRRVYGVARELMSGVDREEHIKRMQMQQGRPTDQRPSPALGPIITDLKAQLAIIEAAYLAALQRIAQNAYLVGMAYGFVIAAVVLTAFAITTGVIGFTAAWLAAGTGGVLGSVLSVLQRMSRGLELGPEGQKQTFRVQGFARPMIGLLLGFASYVLLRGGILSFITPNTGANQTLYYAGIAFLAGFSERFAQDMLATPTKLLSSTSGSGTSGISTSNKSA